MYIYIYTYVFFEGTLFLGSPLKGHHKEPTEDFYGAPEAQGHGVRLRPLLQRLELP